MEDNTLLMLLTADVLARLGYKVTAVYDGAEALAELATGQRYDLLVLDLGLPDIDGREVIRALRHRRPGTPVIVATGYSGPAIADVKADWDRLVVLEKPWTEEHFIAALPQLGLDVVVRDPAGPLEGAPDQPVVQVPWKQPR